MGFEGKRMPEPRIKVWKRDTAEVGEVSEPDNRLNIEKYHKVQRFPPKRLTNVLTILR